MPGLEHGLSRPLTPIEQERLAQLDRLKFFLATAPSRWDTSASANANAPHNAPYPTPSHPALNRFLLPSQEFVTCVLWNGLYHITGTDIVRALVFRFEAFGRPVRNMKKFEEGVFSDLRNLKPGVDACLEEPKSPFLDLLFKYQCIRTQKKQKVFYWFSVPHDRLFLDALERDLKREKMGMESTTVITGEPALSFVYDPKRSLYEQFSKAQGGREGDGDLERVVRRLDEDGGPSANSGVGGQEDADADMDDGFSSADDGEPLDHAQLQQQQQQQSQQHLAAATAPGGGAQPFFSMFTLFEGSPTYKQRRKKPSNKPSGLANLLLSGNPEQERGRFPYRLSAPGHSHSTSSPSNSRHPSPSYGPDGQMVMKTEPGLSAADLFMKQARGELPREGDSAGSGANGKRVDPREVGVYYEGIQGVNPILPPHAQAQLGPHSAGQGPARMLSVPTPSTPSSGQYGNLNRGRSMDGDIYRSYSASPSNASGSGSGLVGPGQGYPQGMSLSAGYANTTFDQGTGPSNSARSFDGYPTSFTPASGQADGSSSNYMGGPPTFAELASDGPPKNHPCPLLSCGRTFKRMEHLKRHLRTHTMERPFVCPKCRKRFSRSDNLGQHLRVHERDAAEASNLNAEQGSDATASGSGSGDAASAAANNGGMNMNEFMNFTGNEPFAANSDSGIDWGLQQWINVHGEISSSDGEGDGASPDSGAGSSPSNNPGSSDRNASNLDADGGELDMDADDLFSMQQQGPQTDIGVELGMFGGQGGAGMGMGMGMGMGGVGLAAVRRGSPSASSDAQANSAANSRRASADLFYLQQQAQQGGQWPVRTSSPTAFGDANGDGQQQQSHPQHANSLPLMGHPSARQQFAQSRHSSTGSVFGGAPLSLGAMSIGSAGTVEDQNGSQFLTIPGSHHIPASLSAPPHKQVFDANAMMFGPEGEDFGAQSQSLNNSPNMHQGLTLAARGLGLMESSAGGAVRRHRSMTPSLHRSGDSFSRSRPGTANSMSGEFPPGTFDNPPAPARGYHPYSTTSSRGGSVTNSPMVGAGMGLDTMGYPMQQRRSPSRASSSHMGSADQGVSANMHHLSLGSGSSLGLSGLERPGSSLSVHSVHSTGGSFGGDVYRTESPTPFMSGQQEQRGSPNASGMQMTDSPSQFLTDLPPSSSYSAQHVPGQQSLNPQQSSSIPRFDKNSNTMFQQLSGDQFGAPFTMDGMDMSSDGHYMGYGQPQHVSSM